MRGKFIKTITTLYYMYMYVVFSGSVWVTTEVCVYTMYLCTCFSVSHMVSLSLLCQFAHVTVQLLNCSMYIHVVLHM